MVLLWRFYSENDSGSGSDPRTYFVNLGGSFGCAQSSFYWGQRMNQLQQGARSHSEGMAMEFETLVLAIRP